MVQEKAAESGDWKNASPAKGSAKWEDVEASFVKLDEVGKSVEGRLVTKGTQGFPSKDGVPQIVGKYTFENPDSEELTTILGSTDLDEKMQRVDVGEYVSIEVIQPTHSRSGREIKQYAVRRRV
jgi:hypothetical protein